MIEYNPAYSYMLFFSNTPGDYPMPEPATNTAEAAGGLPIHGMMMRYNVFVPRLYNWCKSLGFTPGKVMPSRAFCSDESQG
jgi:hypothetical protein